MSRAGLQITAACLVIGLLTVAFVKKKRNVAAEGQATLASLPASSLGMIHGKRSNCASIHECVRRRLPSRYEAGQEYTGWEECLGNAPSDKLDALPCMPMEYGTDARTGRLLEVYLSVGEFCEPYCSGIRYAGVSRAECVCIGGMPVNSGNCVPAASILHNEQEMSKIVLKRSPRGARPYEMESPYLDFYGLQAHDVIDEVDGHSVRGVEAIAQVLSGFPHRPPHEIGVLREGSGVNRIRYVDRRTLDHLARIASSVQASQLPTLKRCGSEDTDTTIWVDWQHHEYDSRCPDDEVKRLAQLTKAIESASVVSAPRADKGPRATCSEIRSLPVSFRVRRDGHDIELRYVDWLP